MRIVHYMIFKICLSYNEPLCIATGLIKIIFNGNVHIDVEFVLVDFDVNKSAIRTARITPPTNIPIIHPVIHGEQKHDFLSSSLFITYANEYIYRYFIKNIIIKRNDL